MDFNATIGRPSSSVAEEYSDDVFESPNDADNIHEEESMESEMHILRLAAKAERVIRRQAALDCERENKLWSPGDNDVEKVLLTCAPISLAQLSNLFPRESLMHALVIMRGGNIDIENRSGLSMIDRSNSNEDIDDSRSETESAKSSQSDYGIEFEGPKTSKEKLEVRKPPLAQPKQVGAGNLTGDQEPRPTNTKGPSKPSGSLPPLKKSPKPLQERMKTTHAVLEQPQPRIVREIPEGTKRCLKDPRKVKAPALVAEEQVATATKGIAALEDGELITVLRQQLEEQRKVPHFKKRDPMPFQEPRLLGVTDITESSAVLHIDRGSADTVRVFFSQNGGDVYKLLVETKMTCLVLTNLKSGSAIHVIVGNAASKSKSKVVTHFFTHPLSHTAAELSISRQRKSIHDATDVFRRAPGHRDFSEVLEEHLKVPRFKIKSPYE
jgi:hypothetical protein